MVVTATKKAKTNPNINIIFVSTQIPYSNSERIQQINQHRDSLVGGGTVAAGVTFGRAGSLLPGSAALSSLLEQAPMVNQLLLL